MALKAKQPYIRVDIMIWDDPVMIGLSDKAFKKYLFAIAWSKAQNGRTPDGLLSDHGISRIGVDSETLEYLQEKKLFEKCQGGYKILKYEEWQVTSQEERDEAHRIEEKREIGKQSAAKRWSRPANPPEEGFDPEKCFEAAWSEWPEDGVFEKREDALESFCAHITNSKDWTAFQAALLKRIKEYHAENKPKDVRRKYLGAFKNFCDTRWRSYIPKSFRSDGAPLALAEAPPPKEVQFAPSTKTPMIRPTYKTYDQQMDENLAKLLAESESESAKGS